MSDMLWEAIRILQNNFNLVEAHLSNQDPEWKNKLGIAQLPPEAEESKYLLNGKLVSKDEHDKATGAPVVEPIEGTAILNNEPLPEVKDDAKFDGEVKPSWKKK